MTGTDLAIRELGSVAELKRSEQFQRDVWGEDDPSDNSDILLAIQAEGGLVAGAFAGDRMLGFLFGFPTRQAHVQHSHRLAVHPGSRGLGLGLRLKMYQRDWCLARAITEVRWTFDPLRRVNARLNIARLGAVARTYYPDYYGPMEGINAGVPSDRLLAEWHLAAPGAAAGPGAAGQMAAGAGGTGPGAVHSDVIGPSLIGPSLIGPGIIGTGVANPDVANPETIDPGAVPGGAAMSGRPDAPPASAPVPDPDTVPDPDRRAGPGSVRVAIPADFGALLARDLPAARAERLAVRAALTAAFAQGYEITGFDDALPGYVLTQVLGMIEK